MSKAQSVELQNVGLRRGNRWILRDINWSITQGTCVAVLGPNGSGKSTLTRILACHLWPTVGQVQVLGGKFGNASLPDIRHSIRLVQAAGPYDIDPTLEAREVVLTGFFGTIGLYDPVSEAMETSARRLLQRVGLDQVWNHRYETLSSGEKVRSLIARALVREPRLLLLDEPAAGLDLLAREQVLATVQAMFERESDPPTCVFVTHHVEELPPATSQIILLNDGRIAACGAPQDVLKPETLSAVYRCPVEVHRNDGRWHLHVNPGKWQQLFGRINGLDHK
jgi:iron complex transport system ATP-binding protein